MKNHLDVLELYPLTNFLEKVLLNVRSICLSSQVAIYIESEGKIASINPETDSMEIISASIPTKMCQTSVSRINGRQIAEFESVPGLGKCSVLTYSIAFLTRPLGVLFIPESAKMTSAREKRLLELNKIVGYYLHRHIIEKALADMGQSMIIMGAHPSMFHIQEMVERLTTVNEPVLIQGESGSGKEVWAAALHALSPRASKPFIAINCAASPSENLLLSQFFGHQRGAFTGAFYTKRGVFELADKGTILLDEIGDIGYELQSLLLRVIETGMVQRIGDEETRRVDVRILSATNQDLYKLVKERRFRHDLFHRIAVFQFTVPPLRERMSDIPHLATYILNWFATQNRLSPKQCSKTAMGKLQHHHWPGNIRELMNVLKRAAVHAEGPIIQQEEIKFDELLETPVPVGRIDLVYHALEEGEEDFWTAVKAPFMKRELTRDEVIAIIERGYHSSGRNLKKLLRFFGMPPEDYHRFVSFLHRHGLR